MEENFNLLSIELERFGGASIKYTKASDDGSEEFRVRLARLCHPDLSDIISNGFKDRVRFLLGFTPGTECVFPYGVSFPKDGFVQFYALVKGPVGDYRVKTPKVRIQDDEQEKFGILISEVRLYIEEGKSSQLSIFGE